MPQMQYLQTAKTRILLLSDTHTSSLGLDSAPYAFRHPLPKADIAIHAGDLTLRGGIEEYETTLQVLSSIDAELKLVIAGNHDLTLDEHYVRTVLTERTHGDQEEMLAQHKQAVTLWKGAAAKEAGVTFLDEGAYSFALSNGTTLRVFASPYTPAFCNMAFPYHRHQDRWNPPRLRVAGTDATAASPIPDDVDICITHGPPMGVMDGVRLSNSKKDTHVGCKALTHALSRTRPLLAVFGHIHEGWGAERVTWGTPNAHDPERSLQKQEKVVLDRLPSAQDECARVDVSQSTGRPLAVGNETLCVNAAIMNLRYKPHNPPWVVDLDLPVGNEGGKL